MGAGHKQERQMDTISAQVSVYPLRQVEIRGPIDEALATLHRYDVQVRSGEMSTQIWGEENNVFAALQSAFRGVAEGSDVVMVVIVSNACPKPWDPCGSVS